jgi:hypothetical protein
LKTDIRILELYPGNGGIAIDTTKIKKDTKRSIMIKGYDDGVGITLKVIQALELISIF